MPAQETASLQVSIRPATAEDETTIKAMIRSENLDITSLKWRNFLVAEHEGDIISIGQIKQYSDCQELGSLVTKREFRGQGVAAKIIAALEERAERPLYLLCVWKMQRYYVRFGYQRIPWREAPRILKLKLLPTFLIRLFGILVIVMRKD